MSAARRPITSLQVKNFKAVRDSGVLRPGSLTAFVGDNGTGKSSLLEALRFVATLAHDSLDNALAPFKGYEHVRWNGSPRRGHAVADEREGEVRLREGQAPRVRVTKAGDRLERDPIEIRLKGHVRQSKASAVTRISGQNQNLVVFEHEELSVEKETYERGPKDRPDRSLLQKTSWFDDWQFLDLEPGGMGQPVRRTRTTASIRLLPTGENLAEYLFSLRNFPEEGAMAFEGLLEALQVILPYADDLETEVKEVFEREVAFRLHEGAFTVPGWMLSTGTLRLVALLALLRHPRPPSLLCVEEVENGLDPRTIHLVVRELLRAAESGRTQIMLTTHSPYLLDLLPLESLILVARDEGGPPRFDRPADHAEVREWSKRFAPGHLYTMGTLHERRGR